MSKFTIASLKNRFTALRKHRPNTPKLAAVVAVVVLSLWFLNYLTDGALFVILGWFVFLSLFGFILVLISPDGAVKLVKQLIEESAAYRAKLKRSYKELRELLKKKRMPRIVVDDEPEAAVTSGPAPSASASGSTSAPAPAPTSTAPRPTKTTKPRTTTSVDVTTTSAPAPVPAPAPVKSSIPVTGKPDALARVASATSRRRGTTAARTLSMPGEGESDKS